MANNNREGEKNKDRKLHRLHGARGRSVGRFPKKIYNSDRITIIIAILIIIYYYYYYFYYNHHHRRRRRIAHIILYTVYVFRQQQQ